MTARQLSQHSQAMQTAENTNVSVQSTPTATMSITSNPLSSELIKHNTGRLGVQRLADGAYFISHERIPRKSAALPPLTVSSSSQTKLVHKQLDDATIAEIQSLRNSNPNKWTTNQLAKAFSVSPLMISKYAPCPKERLERLKTKEQNRWQSSGKVRRAKLLRRISVKETEGW